jgi:ATP-dependent helicase HrpA
MTFAVVDERGKRLGAGKSLPALQLALAPKARESVARAVDAPAAGTREPALERAGLTTWDFDSLDRVRDTKHGPNTIRAYPALVDEGASVSIRLMATPGDQARAHRQGVRRMLRLAIPSPLPYVQEHLTTTEKLTLAQGPYRNTTELFEDCLVACIDAVVGDRPVWTRAEFEAVRAEVSGGIVDSLFRTVALVASVIAAAREADKAIKATTSIALIGPLGDARSQLDALVYPGFVSATGLERLRRLPAYLAGLIHRVGRIADNVGRDRVWMTEVQQATARYVEAGGRFPLPADAEPRLARARWMLEELRLGLFAQHIPTAEPASLQRITKVLAGTAS